MGMFREIRAEELALRPAGEIGGDWMLIAAEAGGRADAMTASWGGLGVLWGKAAAFVFVRQSRFTKTLLDQSGVFSLTFWERPQYAEMLAYMGRASGRNEDKIARCGLTVLHDGGAPYFAEAKRVLICRTMGRQLLGPESFLDGAIRERFYAGGDWHDFYAAEITRVLVKE